MRPRRWTTLDVNDDYAIGVEIVRRALTEPAYLIATNAGYDGHEVVARVSDDGRDGGFDALHGPVRRHDRDGHPRPAPGRPLGAAERRLRRRAAADDEHAHRRGADPVGRQPRADDRVRRSSTRACTSRHRTPAPRSRWASGPRSADDQRPDDRPASGRPPRSSSPTATRRSASSRRRCSAASGSSPSSRRRTRPRRARRREGAGPTDDEVAARAALVEALWTPALLSYARCFAPAVPPASGRLSPDDLAEASRTPVRRVARRAAAVAGPPRRRAAQPP